MFTPILFAASYLCSACHLALQPDSNEERQRHTLFKIPWEDFPRSTPSCRMVRPRERVCCSRGSCTFLEPVLAPAVAEERCPPRNSPCCRTVRPETLARSLASDTCSELALATALAEALKPALVEQRCPPRSTPCCRTGRPKLPARSQASGTLTPWTEVVEGWQLLLLNTQGNKMARLKLVARSLASGTLLARKGQEYVLGRPEGWQLLLPSTQGSRTGHLKLHSRTVGSGTLSPPRV